MAPDMTPIHDPADDEPGSDELLFATPGVTEAGVMHPALLEAEESMTEEHRLRGYSGTGAPEDEPGVTYPSTDRPPPDDEDHPEFDPMPVELPDTPL